MHVDLYFALYYRSQWSSDHTVAKTEEVKVSYSAAWSSVLNLPLLDVFYLSYSKFNIGYVWSESCGKWWSLDLWVDQLCFECAIDHLIQIESTRYKNLFSRTTGEY